ncbi:TPA: DUF6287 domain-containing protein [Streptococcus suis]
MKKNNLLTATALVASLVLLGACSGKKTATKASSSASSSQQASSTSKSSSTATSSSQASSSTRPVSSTATASGQAGMDIQAILAGDFSSIKGTWRNKAGHTMMFDETGLVSEAANFGDYAEIKDGMYQTGVYSVAGPGYALVMVPAGVVIPDGYFYDGSDPSDSSRDRIFGAQNVLPVASFDPMYKQSDIASVEEWKRADTGIALENGQSTIDYANTFLSDQGWSIIEDNYNRTEATPYSLVQGSNDFPYLYYIYRNGVIVSTDGTLVYAP